MSLTAGVLRDDALRSTNDGAELDVRLPWYRSLPLSCVEGVDVSIAGRRLAADDVRFRLGERTWRLSELDRHWDEWWFVLDPATLLFGHTPEVRPGASLPVSVRLDCRIPYIMIGPDRALVQSVQVDRELTVR